MTRTQHSEAAQRADFTQLRYAQVWEDADILLEALDIQPGDECVGIASAGDNVLAMLAKAPRRVVALDMNPTQLMCLALRVAAFRTLPHAELLAFFGARGSVRHEAYTLVREALAPDARQFWDAHLNWIQRGVLSAGKFENYFRIFRTRVLPLVHSQQRIDALLAPKFHAVRIAFYEQKWNTLRWRMLFRVFFSRFTMGRLGRDPAFFRYVEGSVADRILQRVRHALTENEPAENPYLRWILKGVFDTLPFWLREENFEAIRGNLDRLDARLVSVEEFLSAENTSGTRSVKWNLSDIFEYMSESGAAKIFEGILRHSPPGSRLAYWNMLAPRRAPEALRTRIAPLEELSARLHARDKAFFYSAFVVEEIR